VTLLSALKDLINAERSNQDGGKRVIQKVALRKIVSDQITKHGMKKC